MALRVAAGAGNHLASANDTTWAAGHTGTVFLKIKPNWNSGDSADHVFLDVGIQAASGPGGKFLRLEKYLDNNCYMGFGDTPDYRVVFADTGVFVSGVWADHMLTWDDSAPGGVASRYYVNNVQKGTNASLAIPDWQSQSTDRVSIGDSRIANVYSSSSVADSDIAEFARWNRVLSSGERTQLAAGYSPIFIPSGLVEYRDFRTNDKPYDNGPYTAEAVDLTVNQSGVSYVAHPTVIYPLSVVDTLTPSESVSVVGTTVSPAKPTPNVILSSDWGVDTDDIGDHWVAAHMHRLGMINLLGILSATDIPTSAPGTRAALDFLGYQSIPVGAWQGTYPYTGSYHTFDNFATAVRDQFRPGDTRANYPDAAVFYRTLLAASAGNVTIITTGPFTDVRALMNSGPDGISPLTGIQLIQAKVVELVAVCGVQWPTGDPATLDYNMDIDAPSAADVFANWPGPITIVGYRGLGGFPLTGDHLPQPPNSVVSGYGLGPHAAANTNPYLKGWDVGDTGFGVIIHDDKGKRNAIGQEGLVYVALGLSPWFFVAGANGSVTINQVPNSPVPGPVSQNNWTSAPGTRSYLGLSSTYAQMQAYLSQFFDGPWVFDTDHATESVTIALGSRAVNVSDTDLATESVQISMAAGSLFVNDVDTPTESVTVSLSQLFAINVSDTRLATDVAFIQGTLLPVPPDTQGGGGCGDPADLWKPVWLIDMSGMTVIPAGYTAAELRFSNYDIDALSPPYHGRIVDNPTVNRKMMDVFWGVTEVAEIEFTLVNADDHLSNLYTLQDLREQPIVIQRYDMASMTLVDDLHARISSVGLEPGKIIIRAAAPALTLFEQTVPKVLITPTLFPKAVDLQVPIPVVFGNVTQMLCPYINDDTIQNQYDYIVGYGAITISALYRNGPNNTMVTITVPEYTVSTTLYPGYTIVRFPNRQVDFNNAFHKIYADVVGSNRNFADAVKAVLTDTVWGLGQTVDAASFATAATEITNLSIYCDGVLSTERQAQDVLRDMTIVRGMRLGYGVGGLWTLEVDRIPTVIQMVTGDGPGDGQHHIVGSGPRQRANVSNATSRYTVRYRLDIPGGGSTYLFSLSRTVNAFGKEKIVENPFIRDHRTADMVDDYLSKREYFGQDTGELELSQEGRKLIEGNLMRVTYAPSGYASSLVQVIEARKMLATTRVTVAAWDVSIYQYQSSPNLPTDSPVTGPVSTIAAPASPVGLALASSTFIDTDGHAKVFLDADFDENTEATLLGYEIQFKRAQDSIWTSRQIPKARTS